MQRYNGVKQEAEQEINNLKRDYEQEIERIKSEAFSTINEKDQGISEFRSKMSSDDNKMTQLQ